MDEFSVEFPKHWVNDSFYPLLFCDTRYLILRGGAGSGKSYLAVDKIIYRMLKEKNNRFLFVRAVKDTIRNSMYRLFKDRVNALGLSQFFVFKDTFLEILCPATESEIICVGMNDRERLKSLADPTSAWVEEATELEEQDFLQLNMRIRSDKGGYRQTIVTFNPIDENHWIRSYFPDEIEEDLDKKYEAKFRRRRYVNGAWIDFSLSEISSKYVRQIKIPNTKDIVNIDYTLHLSTYEDNRFVNDEYRAELEDIKNRDINYWNIYARAKWGTIGGLVFNPMWKFASMPSSLDEVVYGLDFGYVHPSVLVMVGIKDNKYYVKELAYEKGLTNQQFMKYVQEEKLIESGGLIYADSAEPDRIDEWSGAGFDIMPAFKGNNSVKDGIDLLKSIEVFTDKNNYNLNRELKTYKHKLDNNGKPIEGEYIKVNDDCIAATRYAIYSHSKHNEVKVGFVTRAI